MSSQTVDIQFKFLTLPFEQVHEEIAKLTQTTKVASGGAELFAGKHPDHGPIIIVLPPVGDGMIILPVASQSS